MERALDLEPRCPPALLYLARILERDDPRRPEELLRRLVEADPEDPHAKCLLARQLAMGGRKDEARKLYEEAFDLQPSFASAYYGLARILDDPAARKACIEEFKRVEDTKTATHQSMQYGAAGRHSLAIAGSAPPAWKRPGWPAPAKPSFEAPVTISARAAVERKLWDRK